MTIDTPRTDKLKIPSEALLLLGQKGVPEQIVKAILTLGDHSRQLERELSAAQQRNARLVELLHRMLKLPSALTSTSVSLLSEEMALRTEVREALANAGEG